MNKEREPRREKLTMESMTTMVKETALRSGGHAPTLFVEGSQETVIMIIEELEATHEGRLDQMRYAGWMTGSSGIAGTLEQVFYVSEAWLSKRDKDREITLPPSQDPNRKEVMIISMLNTNQAKVDVRLMEMIRDENDALIALQPYQVPETEGISFDVPLLHAFLEGYVFGLMQPPDNESEPRQ